MTESTHDLIAAEARRLSDLIRLAESGAAEADGVGTRSETVGQDDPDQGPSWSGGGWNN